MATINLGGVSVLTDSRRDLVNRALNDCRAAKTGPRRRARLMFSLNGHALALYHTDPAFRAAMERADYIHADGGFLVRFSRLGGGTGIAERSATTDMIHDIAAEFAKRKMRFYLLGGTDAIVSGAAAELRRLYPGLDIVGSRHGYFTPEEEAAVVAGIRQAAPDVLWVGLGKPKEQMFCLRHADELGCGWIVSCGGCFNFLAGDYKRAPKWMRENSLEWLHRLLSNPRRLFWRYFWTNPYAIFLLLRHSREDLPDG